MKTKIVYLYDEFTGEFLGEYLAQESPLEPNVFITPTYSTILKPLAITEGQVNRFIGGKWSKSVDSRGIWYGVDGVEYFVKSLSDEVDTSWTRENPIVLDPSNGPKTKYTSLEFLERFTETEQLNVVSATMQNAQVKLWYDKMLAASFVDIEDERVLAGLDSLVGAGLLTAHRKTQILEV